MLEGTTPMQKGLIVAGAIVLIFVGVKLFGHGSGLDGDRQYKTEREQAMQKQEKQIEDETRVREARER